MKHIQVGLLSGDKENRDIVANSFGKKGQSSDITLHTLFSDNLLQTTILPEAYPSKPVSLVTTAHMSDYLILACNSSGINKEVGEAALLSDCLGIPGIKVVMGVDSVGLDSYFEQMEKTFSKLSVKEWKGFILSNNQEMLAARQYITNNIIKHRGDKDGYLAIEVDHAFPVTGVGSVILGTVINGTVKKGNKITILPEGQSGIVRSIQVNDENSNEAGPGIHVGLALKGVLPKYLRRGSVITNNDVSGVSEIDELIDVRVKFSVFGTKPKVGDKIYTIAGLYPINGTVTRWDELVSVKFEKNIPYYDKMRITFMDLNSSPSILGSIII